MAEDDMTAEDAASRAATKKKAKKKVAKKKAATRKVASKKTAPRDPSPTSPAASGQQAERPLPEHAQATPSPSTPPASGPGGDEAAQGMSGWLVMWGPLIIVGFLILVFMDQDREPPTVVAAAPMEPEPTIVEPEAMVATDVADVLPEASSEQAAADLAEAFKAAGIPLPSEVEAAAVGEPPVVAIPEALKQNPWAPTPPSPTAPQAAAQPPPPPPGYGTSPYGTGYPPPYGQGFGPPPGMGYGMRGGGYGWGPPPGYGQGYGMPGYGAGPYYGQRHHWGYGQGPGYGMGQGDPRRYSRPPEGSPQPPGLEGEAPPPPPASN